MCSEGSVEYYAGYEKALNDLVEYARDRVDPWLYRDLQDIVREMKDDVIGGSNGDEEVGDPGTRIPEEAA